MPPELIAIALFIFGACLGSFLNVCIYRLPTGLSIVRPGSRCPQCERPILPYDNLPVLSYLWLRGRCRHCGLSISFRYCFVEIITGLAALAAYGKYGLTWPAALLFCFLAALIVVIFIDIDHRIIPDGITLPGIVFFLAGAVATGHLTWSQSLLGILAGGGSLYLVALIYQLLQNQAGMGGGDIKLLAMIGAWCGWPGVFFTILVGSAAGTVVGLVLMAVHHKNFKFAVPFGPFLSLGAITYIFFGPALIDWYFYGLAGF